MYEDKRESNRTRKHRLGRVSLVSYVHTRAYSKHTLFHKARFHDKFFQEAMQRQALWVNNQAGRNRSPHWLGYIEVVCQGDTLAFRDCLDLVLTVTIECCPLNRGRTLVTPVKHNLLSLVPNDQVAPFEMRG